MQRKLLTKLDAALKKCFPLKPSEISQVSHMSASAPYLHKAETSDYHS